MSKTNSARMMSVQIILKSTSKLLHWSLVNNPNVNVPPPPQQSTSACEWRYVFSQKKNMIFFKTKKQCFFLSKNWVSFSDPLLNWIQSLLYFAVIGYMFVLKSDPKLTRAVLWTWTHWNTWNKNENRRGFISPMFKFLMTIFINRAAMIKGYWCQRVPNWEENVVKQNFCGSIQEK